MSVYRLSSPYERAPLGRRAAGLALAVVIDLLLLLALLTLGRQTEAPQPAPKPLVVDLLPAQRSAAAPAATRTAAVKPRTRPRAAVVPKPPVVIPVKPPIVTPPPGLIPMSKEDLAASDLRNLAKPGSGAGDEGDSQAVGTAPNGYILYAAEWARHPTDAELNGYLPRTRQTASESSPAGPSPATGWRIAPTSTRRPARTSPPPSAMRRGSSGSGRRERTARS